MAAKLWRPCWIVNIYDSIKVCVIDCVGSGIYPTAANILVHCCTVVFTRGLFLTFKLHYWAWPLLVVGMERCFMTQAWKTYGLAN